MRLRLLVLILALFVRSSAALAQTTQGDDQNNTRRRTDDPSVPLDKLPTPNQGMIVVTPDLRKALDSLGAGSVVLSAERYQELMKAQEKNKSEKVVPEILFARCLLTGEVKLQAGREVAELTMELEFRTETPQTTVPIPCKGLRMISASINGQPPVWGPDPERWTLLLKEPQLYRLKIIGLVPITRTGAEKKLQLDRLPASAITSLELKIPGTVNNALIVGYGSIPVQAPVGGATTLSAPALGVLSSLELTWQTNESTLPAMPPTVEGDIRVVLSDTKANTEARLKPVPFSPIQLPWRVRVPAGSQQLRAELVRNESQNSEPLIATKQQDGTYIINSPYPLTPAGFTQVLLRWQQTLPEADAVDTVQLGSCQVLEPTGRLQTGLITILQPEEAVALLRPNNVQPDKDVLDLTREMRRSQRYRYTQQPAGVEVVALPVAQTRGIVELKLTHTITSHMQDWQLVSDVDVVRSSRNNLTQLEFFWPGNWPINRRLLFSSAVKDIEQDTKAEKLRIILDGKQPGQFQLRLESTLQDNPAALQFRVPQLLTATGGTQERPIPLELITSSEQIQLEAVGVELQTPTIGTGLRELGAGGSRDLKQLQVRQHPAMLSLRKQPRLPKYTSSMEMAVGRELVLSKQSFNWRTGTLPRQLQILVPRSANKVQFFGCQGDQPRTQSLTASLRSDDTDSPWKRYIVELPVAIEDCKRLFCSIEQESKHPLMVPLARLEETTALHEGVVPVQIKLDAGVELKQPVEMTEWKLEQGRSNTLFITGTGLQSFLVLDRVDAPLLSQPAVVRSSEEHITPLRDGYQVETVIDLAELKQSQWQGSIAAPSEEVQLIGWKLDQQLMPRNLLKTKSMGTATQVQVQLPLDRLQTSMQLTVAWIYKPAGYRFVQQLPGLRWEQTEGSVVPHRWLLAAEPAQWLGWTSAMVSPWTYPQSIWKPIGLTLENGSTVRTIEMVDSLGSQQLRFLVISRYLALMAGSCIGYLLFAQLRGKALALVGWSLLAVLAVLYWYTLPTATLLLWSVLPGITLAGLVRLLRHRLQQRSAVQVFQKSGNRTGSVPTRIGTTGSSLATSVTDAPTIMANPR